MPASNGRWSFTHLVAHFRQRLCEAFANSLLMIAQNRNITICRIVSRNLLLDSPILWSIDELLLKRPGRVVGTEDFS